MKKIVLTGGGTAGHVTPNIALLPELKKLGYQIEYIGSYNGIEKELIENEGIVYHGIDSGKLRRYIDLKNITDPFRVIHGYFEACSLLRTIKPNIIFSKGGFVSVPVVYAAHSLHIPVITHESDMTPGLANKLCFSRASKVCCNFPETVKLLPSEKGVLSGSPIREKLLKGNADAGKKFAGFKDDKPVLMVIGGSLGSVAINTAVRNALPELLEKYNVINICGKGNLMPDDEAKSFSGYAQYEYISEELPDVFAMADVVISRAGANVICELLALKKPNILIPLPAVASRGDQLLNAESFAKQGFSKVIEEASLSNDVLIDAVDEVFENRDAYIKAMSESKLGNGVGTVVRLIEELSK